MTLCNIINSLGDEKMTKTKSQLISIEELIKLFINDRKEGIRQILSMDVYNSEDEMDWNNFFFKLQERGLAGVQLVISDGHY